ncbi:hypothetical protein [Bacillus ndiopicus]|uniref:hypothetical protein n=1 Tax=Bacillus ndiopicus TaxID=1347368 RepID=UPI0005A77B7B|nr:hypothetical protein [Bacillus ndiopicus]
MRKRKLIVIAIAAFVLFSTVFFPYSILSVYPAVPVKVDEMRQKKYNEDFAVFRSLFEERAAQPDYVVSYSVSLLLLYEMDWLTNADYHMKRIEWEQLLTNIQLVKNELIRLSFKVEGLSVEAKMYLEQMIDSTMRIEEAIAYHINKKSTYSRKRINVTIRNLQNDIASSLDLYIHFWQAYYIDK